MPYKLKRNQPQFDVVDGPDKGRKFRHGVVYDNIPRNDLGRFEVVIPPAPESSKPKKGGSTK